MDKPYLFLTYQETFRSILAACPQCQIKISKHFRGMFTYFRVYGMCHPHCQEAVARFIFPWITFALPDEKNRFSEMHKVYKLLPRVSLVQDLVKRLFHIGLCLDKHLGVGECQNIFNQLRSVFKAFDLLFPRFPRYPEPKSSRPDRTQKYFGPAFFSFHAMFTQYWKSGLREALKLQKIQLNDAVQNTYSWFPDKRDGISYNQYTKRPHTLLVLAFKTLFNKLFREMAILSIKLSKKNCRIFKLRLQ